MLNDGVLYKRLGWPGSFNFSSYHRRRSRLSIMHFLRLLPVVAIASGQSFTSLPGALFGSNETWGYSPDSIWPLSDVGTPLEPQKPDAEVQDLISQISVSNVNHTITTLANFGTRHTLSIQNSSTRGIGAARNWILSEMQGYAEASDGRMEVFYNTYIQGVGTRISFPVNLTNVVARINGSSDSNRAYVVTGHYDSRRIDIMDYTNDAPGADDDASGVAGEPFPLPIQEIPRKLTQSN